MVRWRAWGIRAITILVRERWIMPGKLLRGAVMACVGTLVAGLVWSWAVAEVLPACGVPATAEDWQIATQTQSAMEPQRLCALIDWLDELKEANVHSVLVIRGGKLVFEHYRTGADEGQCGPPVGDVRFGPEVWHSLCSVSKSVTSLLVGIALDHKLISSVNEPVYRYVPEYDDLRTPERERITLRHLLTMSSGLAWDEQTIPYTNPANSAIRMIAAPDPYRFAWEQQPVTPPGESYTYNSGSTELLGRIVQKVSGQRLEEFARSHLFAPLDIVDFGWMRNGNTAAASWGLRLRPRDMAKLGQLVLAQGRWGERHIVSETWVRDALAPQIAGPQLYYYGYQWWLGRSLVHQQELVWAAAMGGGGQRIFIVPSRDLVVVVTAGMYQSPMQGWVPLGILNRVLHAVH